MSDCTVSRGLFCLRYFSRISFRRDCRVLSISFRRGCRALSISFRPLAIHPGKLSILFLPAAVTAGAVLSALLASFAHRPACFSFRRGIRSVPFLFPGGDFHNDRFSF